MTDELRESLFGLHYKKEKFKYTVKFDKEVNPCLGIWITKGGYKGEYSCALEPSNGFYDSIKLAAENGGYQKITPLEGKTGQFI